MLVDRVKVVIPKKDRELPIFRLRVKLLQAMHRELTRRLLKKLIYYLLFWLSIFTLAKSQTSLQIHRILNVLNLSKIMILNLSKIVNLRLYTLSSAFALGRHLKLFETVADSSGRLLFDKLTRVRKLASRGLILLHVSIYVPYCR